VHRASGEAGFLGKLAGSRVAKPLLRADEAARQRQPPPEGRLSPGDEQDGELIMADREDHEVHATGTALTEGILGTGQVLEVTAESDRLVLFGDGIEADTVPLTWGQTARIELAARSLRLLR